MEHESHEVFLSAIANKEKLRLLFFSKEDKSNLTRICAPMDFGPLRKARDQTSRYHFYDYDSDKRSHTLSLVAKNIVTMTPMTIFFDPAEFITWNVNLSPWFISREWGNYS